MFLSSTIADSRHVDDNLKYSDLRNPKDLMISRSSSSNLSPRDWTSEHVAQWLASVGFTHYADLLANSHKIDGSILLSLSETDLREKPLQLTVLGDIKRLYAAIQVLKVQCMSVFVEF